jgi:ribose-phosphate pyrophosphokinase
MSDSLAPVLCALRESQELALQISRSTGLERVPIEERPFEEGEFKLRPLESVRDRTVFVVHSLAGSRDLPVALRLIRLLFLLFGLRDAGAAKRIALIPYLTFARKDRRTQVRDPVNTRYIAELLESTAVDRVVALDVHNPAAFDNAFRIPTDHLSCAPMFVDHFATRFAGQSLAVASPDVGGVKRAQRFRELLEKRVQHPVELAFIEKRRALGSVETGRAVGDVKDRHAIVLDDLCATGGTLIRAADVLRAAGAASVSVAFTHAPNERGLEALTQAPAISHIVVSDSVGSDSHLASFSSHAAVHILSIAPLLAQVVMRIVEGVPLASLLSDWPPTDPL